MKNTAIPELEAVSGACPGEGRAVRQRGGIMIESLIGLLLLSLIGGGVMHATARMANTQQLQAMHNISVNQLRVMAMTRKGTAGADICTGTNHVISVPGAAEPAALSVKGCAPASYKISNVKIGGTVLNNQTVASARPVVIEVGADAEKVRVGGAEVVDAPAR